MENQISLEQIKKFSKVYNTNKENKVIENLIVKNGLENTAINKNIIIENEPVFNIELPQSKRYDQKTSHTCWVYAGLNMIKYNIAQNLNIDIMELELSNNYIAFFDKLEKSNNTYENIIELENADIDYITKERILRACVASGGYWQYFVSIINKYGIVPSAVMPEVVESKDYSKIEKIFSEKVKKDALKLLRLKQQNESLGKIREIKKKYLQENYSILSKILGEPKFNFDYEYKDKNNEQITFENITPIEFKNKFLTLNLNDFVSIGNFPMYNKEYYKLYQKKYRGNVYKTSKVGFLNLPIGDIKQLVIKQLKGDIPVWVGLDYVKFKDKQSKILDVRLYNYEEMLGIKYMTKEEALNTDELWFEHAMSICGVQIVKNKPVRWKVEDSAGDDDKLNGYYIMNDNYFDRFVLNVIIDKKYLSKEQLEMLKQEPIQFGIVDPF